jgi:hypothetical protein
MERPNTIRYADCKRKKRLLLEHLDQVRAHGMLAAVDRPAIESPCPDTTKHPLRWISLSFRPEEAN